MALTTVELDAICETDNWDGFCYVDAFGRL